MRGFWGGGTFGLIVELVDTGKVTLLQPESLITVKSGERARRSLCTNWESVALWWRVKSVGRK